MTACGNDQEANLRQGEAFCRQARAMEADVALFPEMWNIGYTPYAEYPGFRDIGAESPEQQHARAIWQAQPFPSPIRFSCTFANWRENSRWLSRSPVGIQETIRARRTDSTPSKTRLWRERTKSTEFFEEEGGGTFLSVCSMFSVVTGHGNVFGPG